MARTNRRKRTVTPRQLQILRCIRDFRIRNGYSPTMQEIGDHLGHTHPDTTRIYAKVDLASLREVANFDIGGVL